jgi:hypothetical protein
MTRPFSRPGWGPLAERSWQPAWLGQVPPSTTIGPRALCAGNSAARTDAQVRVQVTDASELVVGRSSAALERLRGVLCSRILLPILRLRVKLLVF